MGEWADRYGSQATRKKQYIGKVTNFFSNINVAELKLETRGLSLKEEIMIIGPTTGVIECRVEEIRLEEKPVPHAAKGDICSIPLPEAARRGDKVFRVTTVEEPF
jgi:U32 family peptidase